MPIPGEKRYTVEEFYSLGIEEPCELIDGKICYLWTEDGEAKGMSPSPSIRHQDISMAVSCEIKHYIKKNGGKCRVFAAPTNVKLNDGTLVVPDIFVACKPENFDEQKYNGAPDWIIEIISPSNGLRDYRDKFQLYRNAEVKEYWIIDPSAEKIMAYKFGDPNTVEFYNFDDRITAGIFKDKPEPLTICLNEIL